MVQRLTPSRRQAGGLGFVATRFYKGFFNGHFSFGEQAGHMYWLHSSDGIDEILWQVLDRDD